jgi:hypothetical protein
VCKEGVKLNAMKTYSRGSGGIAPTFMTSVLDESQWPVSLPGRSTSRPIA